MILMLNQGIYKKIFFALFFALVSVAFLFPSTVEATQSDSQGSYSNSKLNKTTSNNNSLDGVEIKRNGDEIPTVGVPNVKMGEVENLVNKKGSDLIGLFQTIAKWIMIALFIFGANLLVIGVIDRSSSVAKGLTVMVLAILIYSGIDLAPEILNFSQDWLKE